MESGRTTCLLLLFSALSTNVLAEDPPRIETYPKDQTVASGGKAVFVCTAVGNPNPQIEWRKNGKRMTTQRYTTLDMPNGSVLRIEPVRAGRDDAVYECVAENCVGEPVRALASLTVLSEDSLPEGFPKFVREPNTQGIEKGRNALLPCEVKGIPEPQIKWLKNMIPLDMSIPRYALVQGYSLQITDAEEEDQGHYECMAENSVGSALSETAILFVRVYSYPPYFSIRPEGIYEVMPGKTLNITCVAVGSPMPYVKWRKGSVDITPEHAIPIGRNVLILEDIRESANYTCIAASELGSIETTAQVVVLVLPRPPTNVRISDVTATTVRLSWSYDIGSENIVYYIIQYKPKQANQEYNEIAGITTMFDTVRDLSPHTEYEFYVIAVNSNGRGSPSTPVVATAGETEPGEPGSAPRNVRARPLSSSTVLIQWDPPKEPNGQVTGYKVYYTTKPNLPMSAWNVQSVGNNQLTTLSDLTPHTIYAIRIQASISQGPGPHSAPVQVKTHLGVPNQPSNLRVAATSSKIVQVSWAKPISGVKIVGYELYWNDTFTQQQYHKSLPDVDTYTLIDLYPDTLYYVWVAAKSRYGEGAATSPSQVRTDQYVPGEPRQIKINAINSTTITVRWKPPANKDRYGLIQGYQIHVQEITKDGDMFNEPKRYDVANENAEEYNVTGLQPDTMYSIQVTAVTRNGDGTHSQVKTERTEGGVPTKPDMTVQLIQEEPNLVAQVQWSRPSNIFGQLMSYRLRYGRSDTLEMEEQEIGPLSNDYQVSKLDRGARYEFFLSGKNEVGWGQESHAYLDTPEGTPSSPPQNVTHRLQSPSTVVISWSPLDPQYRNGKITHYSLQFHKSSEGTSSSAERNTTDTRMVFSNLDENTEYTFRARAFTSKGSGPYSPQISVQMPGDVPPAPTNVQAAATSDHSVEVWWDEVPYSVDILGYQVLYIQSPVEDLDQWSSKQVPLTWSAELTGLDSHAMYAIRVAAITRLGLGRLSELVTVRVNPTDVPTQLRSQDITTHSMSLSWRRPSKLDPNQYKISYGAHKEFYTSQGFLAKLSIPTETVFVEADITEYSVGGLMPFTSYEVNITAIPQDEIFRPPAKITVTTAMAAPKPMVKPDSFGVRNGWEITVILPSASEEYGPISHYFLVVVPTEEANKDPGQFTIEELSTTPTDQVGPYIAAKFFLRSIPGSFPLGDDKTYGGYVNRRLLNGQQYSIFVRAVVDTPQKSLYTSSPFSDPVSLDMKAVPGQPPIDHIAKDRSDRPDVSQINNGTVKTNKQSNGGQLPRFTKCMARCMSESVV